MPGAPDIFDRRAVRAHRERAAPALADHDFLFNAVGEMLVDRLDDVRRDFPLALDLGCHGGQMGALLGGRGAIGGLVQCDLSYRMVRRAGRLAVVADEEFLPFAEASFDLVLSCLSLHWVNDLPGSLIQIRRVLKPDGLFLGALFGAGSLGELRAALHQAEELEAASGAPRISPFADIRDAGALLQRAGFALPVADRDRLMVSYGDPYKLMRDLRGMGETNALGARRRNFTGRNTLAAAADHYTAMHGDADGRIPASFEILLLTGWAPHADQPKPAAPGSATARLADALREDGGQPPDG